MVPTLRANEVCFVLFEWPRAVEREMKVSFVSHLRETQSQTNRGFFSQDETESPLPGFLCRFHVEWKSIE